MSGIVNEATVPEYIIRKEKMSPIGLSAAPPHPVRYPPGISLHIVLGNNTFIIATIHYPIQYVATPLVGVARGGAMGASRWVLVARGGVAGRMGRCI